MNKLFSLFKDIGLKITAEANLKNVQFLDVSLDINDGTFNFSEMVDGNKNVLNESDCYLDLYTLGGKCQTLITSVGDIGTDMKHSLTITYP